MKVSYLTHSLIHSLALYLTTDYLTQEILDDGKSQKGEERLRFGTTTRSGNAGNQVTASTKKPTQKTKKSAGGVRKKQNTSNNNNLDDQYYENNL